MRHLLLMTSICLLVSGCSSTPTAGPLPNDPFYAPVIPQMPSQKISHDGSIFQAALANGLYSDVKAHRVGDIITVVLRENTSASKAATNNSKKEQDTVLAPIVGLAGQNVNIGKEQIQLTLDSSNEFKGTANANQSNTLNGNISVTVVQVMPNNNLVIRGEKWLTLNNGDEYIRLTGIVRPADINPGNEIQSNKIANARIQYSGTGSFAEAQQPGWLGKFFSSTWWPF